MANKEQLKRLKEKGVQAWNEWRQEDPDKFISLVEAQLSGMDLQGIDLNRAKLEGTNLRETNLRGADFSGADLRNAYLSNADLRDADFSTANLFVANLSEADLTGADLRSADLGITNLSKANLSGVDLNSANLGLANLTEANFTGTDLTGTDLTGADLSGATFTDVTINVVDLSTTRGLGSVIHHGPSSIGLDTLRNSRGKIPAVFLKGCGLADWEIKASLLYDYDLAAMDIGEIAHDMTRLRADKPMQVANLFISYSRADTAFIDALGNKLDESGVRYWRDEHDTSANPSTSIVLRAMRDATVLLVLSESSVHSKWFAFEARHSREMEKQGNRNVICPIALDPSWRSCDWPKILRKQIEKYKVLDFANWHQASALDETLNLLLSGQAGNFPADE